MASLAAPRLYLLDTLRGLASLSVVIWHYQHFFYVAPGTLSPEFAIGAQPFFNILSPFYQHGYLAVQLFFSLSGFVFFLIYADALREGKISGTRFFVLRFSRLYRLHFLMLLVVALGQYFSQRIDGQFLVYPYNDAWHFLLHLFFASDWGLQKGFSFNSPVWSVSVEVLIYAIFFAFARFALPRFSGRAVPIMAAIGMFSVAQKTLPIMEWRTVASACVCFFLGGLIFEIWSAVRSRPAIEVASLAAVALGVCLSSVGAYVFLTGNNVVFRLVTFPSAILALALFQSLYPTAGRASRFIGDITYSTYLIHCPIQLAILLAIKQWGLAIDFYSPLAFAAFFGAVIALSIPTYHGFELPMQKWLRGRLLVR